MTFVPDIVSLPDYEKIAYSQSFENLLEFPEIGTILDESEDKDRLTQNNSRKDGWNEQT